jgi:hypothetical protein
MRAFVRFILAFIFILSASFLLFLCNISTYRYKGVYPGGLIALGLIATVCIWSFIYFECNYKPEQDNLQDR